MILTKKILMIEPVGFRFNEETAADNVFQQRSDSKSIKSEFENFQLVLSQAGIEITTLHPSDSQTPDAVFPNNWFSTFPDKSFFIYPMKTSNRRSEKRSSFIKSIEKNYSSTIDLSYLEKENSILEGTGSLIIDHQLKVAFASLSERTNKEAIKIWSEKTNYRCVSFHSSDQSGEPIYHTNVMMTLAADFAIICMEGILNDERAFVKKEIEQSGRTIIDISFAQMNNMCGNCLALTNDKNEKLLIMSERAFYHFTKEQRAEIERTCRIISSPLTEIENIGGGSARCMIAELF